MISSGAILLRLGLAAVLGGLIGLERERKNWAAGLRTHMMVCVGSCLIMIVSAYGFADVLHDDHISLDPSRVAAQVVSGIGFIGAGTILFIKHETIRGLTTAAGLWTVAAIGLASGGGLYFAAMATTVIALIILWAIQPLESWVYRKKKRWLLRIVIQPDGMIGSIIQQMMDTKPSIIENLVFYQQSEESIYELKITNATSQDIQVFLEQIQSHPGVKQVSLTD
ncbi:MAG: MgtC/SapB family protein [Saprospiraceae bacterium]|nr:MAG: MgtC/SapB transporter [Bacteroidetes bacterium OLB9]MCO6462588.1 MgtC/SapB family protein [Saprospiraceae bacterium]MCZ2338138.1 MgtC/SapB family protein [Chitinophagales bacterium]